MRRRRLSASLVLPRVRQHDARRAAVRSAWLRGQEDEARAPRVVRGLPRARYFDGHHAQRRGGYGWRASARRRERVVSAAANLRAPRGGGDHAFEAHHHLTEQDRFSARERGGEPVRRDREVHPGHDRGRSSRDSHLGAAQVQHRRGVRVHLREDPGAKARLHLAVPHDRHPELRREQARRGGGRHPGRRRGRVHPAGRAQGWAADRGASGHRQQRCRGTHQVHAHLEPHRLALRGAEPAQVRRARRADRRRHDRGPDADARGPAGRPGPGRGW
mmetsp:Transcript_9386/g.39847  ORF Transcript_9386/g.39847 Transcript_9386/m.39847 type:complete len:274 (-) Transcript_9386:468-1289(-)